MSIFLMSPQHKYKVEIKIVFVFFQVNSTGGFKGVLFVMI